MEVIYIDPEEVKIELLPHQIKTVRKVIDEMDGRAILADEVGLGKTIEAGMIIREYMERGDLHKLLILVPASLAFQWTEEMVNKIGLNNIFYNRKGRCWDYFDYQIASIDMAKRERHSKYLTDIDFDMVVVDEAHKLKNENTLNWKFVNSLKKKYCLLLTATPIHNDLKELYNLITILYPDIYNNYKEFKKKYSAGKYVIKNNEYLKDDLNGIMIRNYHTDTVLNSSQREIKPVLVELTKEERELYDKVSYYVKKEYKRRKNKKQSILNLLTYQREICSSPHALQCTLAKKRNRGVALDEIFKLSGKIDFTGKIQELIKILKNNYNNQVIIFTEFRATQAYIAYHLEKRGFRTIFFNGGFSSSGKEWIKRLFQKKKDVLISTEAGSQGLNLQFCNILVNYDLPWNPMKLEQRIGRIHRLGQKNNVYIYNLVTKNTIEEKILQVLNNKINLFKNVVGDMEDILVSGEYNNFELDILRMLDKKELEGPE